MAEECREHFHKISHFTHPSTRNQPNSRSYLIVLAKICKQQLNEDIFTVSQAAWQKAYAQAQGSETMQNCELQYLDRPTMLGQNAYLPNYKNWRRSRAQTRRD
jgi:hypothetical protein